MGRNPHDTDLVVFEAFGCHQASRRKVIMVGSNSVSIEEPEREQIPHIRCVGDRRATSETAARAARKLAARIHPGRMLEGVDEQAVFGALQACAYRVTRRVRKNSESQRKRHQWFQRWKRIRDHLVEDNLGLVYTMMNRFRSREVDWEEQRSEALYALMRAVEGFNPWAGYKFSTYACNAILRALVNNARKTNRYRSRFPMEHDDWHECPERQDEWAGLYADRLNRVLNENLCELTDREALILGWRFPMDGSLSLTLGEVGHAIGLSKERVRQIQKSALNKLREVIEADPLLQ
jgi:RNA polymerase primary sigma factor